MGLIQHLLAQFFGIQLQSPEVNPLEIGPLQRGDLDVSIPSIFRKLPNELVIFLNISQA